MWYFIPNDWTLIDLIGPNQVDYLQNATYSVYDDDLNILEVNSTIVNNTSGVYLINAESNNYIKTCKGMNGGSFKVHEF